jgi:hypothetical protein
MSKILMTIALLLSSFTLSGCLLGAAVGAGAVAADEIGEDDGEFDPLEKTYDGDEDTGPLDGGDSDDDD